MKRFNSWLAVVPAAVLLAAAGGCNRSGGAEAKAAQPQSIVRVTVGKPQRKTLRLYTTQPGQLDAFEQTPIHPKVSGYIGEVLVDIGQRVEKDDLLAKISVPELDADLAHSEALVAQADAGIKKAQAAVRAMEAASKTAQTRIREAEAGVARADAQLVRWKSEYRRITELADNGSVTKKLVDETLNQLKAAEAARQETEASVDSAKAAFVQSQADIEKAKSEETAAGAELGVAKATQTRAQTMLAYTQIKAPFKGVVTQRNVDTGHFTQATRGADAKPLFVVAQSDTVRVFVDVPEMEAALVDEGDAATVQIQSLRNREVIGKVTRTSWTLDPANRSLRTEIDLANKDLSLRPGMYATVRILLEERPNALVLPISAVMYEKNETFCNCVKNGKIVRQPLKVGLRSGDEVEVLDGLGGDETVVLLASSSLAPGQAVEVSETATK
jgi:HlyD family secretion protein